MGKAAVVLVACFLAAPAWGQSPDRKTIEGYWQDTARRILFSVDAPPGYVYGQWHLLDQQQTYPTAKRISRSATGFDLVDLLYDDDEVIKVLKSSSSEIEFTRTTRWSGCAVHHRCGLEQDQLLCSLRTTCPQQGAGERLVWAGEERYARRASCVQTEIRRAQGIPVACR
jgi:hypothetical protein